MWEASDPSPEDDLSQGDYLEGVPLFVRQSGPAAQGETLQVETLNCVVVSHCCTTANNGVVSVARVQTLDVARTPAAFVSSLRAEIPVDPQDPVNVATNYFLLGDDRRLGSKDGKLKVVNLLQTRVLVRADDGWLRERRRARMTVIGRRALRSRLALHWARTSDEDRRELEELGEPLIIPTYNSPGDAATALPER